MNLDIERQKFQAEKEQSDKLLSKFEEMINSTKNVNINDLNNLNKTFVSTIQDVQKQLEKVISENKNTSNSLIADITISLSRLETKLKDLVNTADNNYYSKLEEVNTKLVTELDRIKREIPEMPNMKLVENRMNRITDELIKIKISANDLVVSTVKDIEKKIPQVETGESLVVKIQEVKRPWLSIEAIDGDFNAKVTKQFGGGNTVPLNLYVNNENYGGIREVNIVGSGVSAELINGVMTVNVGGSGFTKETPTGVINGSNTSFTVTSEPNYVVSDGITYFANAGYTYSSLTITMDTPPAQYIRSYY